MKLKSFFATLVAVLVASVASAQNEFGKGDLGLNINYGIGEFNCDVDDYDDNVFLNSLGASLEYGILDGIIKGKGTVAVGAQVGVGFGSESQGFGDLNCSRIRIATRGVFHYQFVPQLDTYAGITFGIVDINKYKYKYEDGGFKIESDVTDSDFIFPVAFVGARYMFSDAFGINMELSWDSYAYMAIGVSFKF